MNHNLIRIGKLWAGLTTPAYRRALKSGVGATVEHRSALQRFSFDTVVDIGANRGQFATFARATFPQARIVSFEPLKEPADRFSSLFVDDPRVTLVRSAVGATAGDLVMHVTEKEDSSSLLEVGALQNATFGSIVVETRLVQCAPLEQLLRPEELGRDNLLKIDTQGYELEVLKGSEAYLPSFTAIYCELSFAELYIGQPTASTVIRYLHERCFELRGVYNQASSRRKALQADFLFERVPS
mgnify:CR=1 FL=1